MLYGRASKLCDDICRTGDASIRRLTTLKYSRQVFKMGNARYLRLNLQLEDKRIMDSVHRSPTGLSHTFYFYGMLLGQFEGPQMSELRSPPSAQVNDSCPRPRWYELSDPGGGGLCWPGCARTEKLDEACWREPLFPATVLRVSRFGVYCFLVYVYSTNC